MAAVMLMIYEHYGASQAFSVLLLRRCVDRTSQHSPWGSTQDFLGSVPMRAVPIW